MNGRTLLLVAAMASPGCSFTLARSPPERVLPGSYAECGTPPGAMVGDVTLGLAGGLVAANQSSLDGPLLVAAATSALFISSAAWGLTKEHACREVRDKASPTGGYAQLRVQPPPEPQDAKPAPVGTSAPPASKTPPSDPAAAPPTPVQPTFVPMRW